MSRRTMGAVFVTAGLIAASCSTTTGSPIDPILQGAEALPPTNAGVAEEAADRPGESPLYTLDADQIFSPLSRATNGIAIVDDALWTSTDQGIVRWNLDSRQAQLYSFGDDPRVTLGAGGLVAGLDGTVWTITFSQDLARFDGISWSEPAGYGELDIVNPRCVPYEPCLNPITAMAAGAGDLLYVAIGPETLFVYDGVEWNVLPVTPLEVHGDGVLAWAGDMAVAPDGTLWAASWEELLSYDGDVWTRFTTANGLPSGGIASVVVAPNGDVWIATTDDFDGSGAAGVARFDGDSWRVFDEADGLYENAVTTLTVGSDGTVWAVHDASDTPGAAEVATTGGVSRFDGVEWSATTLNDVGLGLGWGGALADAAGTLWITSRWGIVGFGGEAVSVLRVDDAIPPPAGAPDPVESRFSDAVGPIEWVWDAERTSDLHWPESFRAGPDCYGSSDPPNASTKEVSLRDATLSMSVGLHVSPDVAYTAADGITDVSNPFGDEAWVCSVGADGTQALAVGSSVWWSGDGVSWSVIDAFEDFSGATVNGSDLIWSAVGPLGYIVLGSQNRDGWYSQDLETWHRIPGEGPEYISRGWFGPGNVTITDQMIVIGSGGDGVWIGTPRSESGTG